MNATGDFITSSKQIMANNVIGGRRHTKALKYPSGSMIPHMTATSHQNPNLESPPATNIPPIVDELIDFGIQ